MEKKTAIILGVGILGTLAVAGFVWGVSKEMLRAIPSDKRRDVLRHMARMRPVGESSQPFPGEIHGRSQMAEYRPTTPSAWSESILSWIERMNEAGYSIAYWEAEDPSRTTVVAFAPEEEKALAAHRYGGATKPGWVLLLDPGQFTKTMAGDNRDDLLRGTAEVVPILRGPGDMPLESRSFKLPWEKAEDKPKPQAADAGGAGVGWIVLPLSPGLSGSIDKGRRYAVSLNGGAVVEGVYQGLTDDGKVKLQVDRVEMGPSYKLGDPIPKKGLWELPVWVKGKLDEDDSYPYVQEAEWVILHPSAVSVAALSPTPTTRPKPGTKVWVVLRETNSLGRAVVVIDGYVMTPEAIDPSDAVRVSTNVVVKKVRGVDVVLPAVVIVPLENLADPTGIALA